MKKTIIVAVLALMGSTAVCAQERMSAQERTAAMAERIKNSAMRVAKDFNLTDDAQKTFISIYSDYQKEMFATNQMRGQRFEQPAGSDEKKEMTEEEATAKIQENFTRQEEQIATMQKRLEVQKKYAEEFGKVLTPQQVLKVLTPQRGQGGRDQMQRRNAQGGERRGGFGEGGPRGGFGGGPRGGFGGGF